MHQYKYLINKIDKDLTNAEASCIVLIRVKQKGRDNMNNFYERAEEYIEISKTSKSYKTFKRRLLRESTLIENANYVFERIDADNYRAMKSRFTGIIIGGVYSIGFVKLFASTNADVYIYN